MPRTIQTSGNVATLRSNMFVNVQAITFKLGNFTDVDVLSSGAY